MIGGGGTTSLISRVESFMSSSPKLAPARPLSVIRPSGDTPKAFASRTTMSIETFCLPPSTATMQPRVTRAPSANCSWVQPFFERRSRTRRPSAKRYSLRMTLGRFARRNLSAISKPSTASRATTQPVPKPCAAGRLVIACPPRIIRGGLFRAESALTIRRACSTPGAMVADNATTCGARFFAMSISASSGHVGT